MTTLNIGTIPSRGKIFPPNGTVRSANDLLSERRFTNQIRRSHSPAGSWPGNSGHSPGGELLLLRLLNAAAMTCPMAFLK
jgi:hypothetical protein